jgi:Pyruvate/2-oxoacid:ferredoxin oxidoreductase delta subunit
MAERQIIAIDEDKCNGCGQCLAGCAEGALELVNGKVRVVADVLCDGLGACLGECPRGALAIVRREAPEFDEQAVLDFARARPVPNLAPSLAMHDARREQAQGSGSCPSSAAQEFTAMPRQGGQEPRPSGGQLRHWPVKLRLMQPTAPFLRGARILIAADCAGAASTDLHVQTAGRLLLIACPKFEPRPELVERLRALIAQSGLAGLDVLRMEVPCCAGLTQACRQAADMAGASFRPQEYIMRRDGGLQ